MQYDGTLLRLFVSQAIALLFILVMLPLKKPGRQSVVLIVLGASIITFINALLIILFGISFYIRFYILSLTLPYIILGMFFSLFKGGKYIFVILTIQVIGNVAIVNGLLASYLVFNENNPYIDTVARVLTYLIFLPIMMKFIRPTYLKMTEVIKYGWWMLNSALVVSYALAYYILFVPDAIFNRPEYFIHAYIGILLSLFIYAIIFYLFIEVQAKINAEHDKFLLSNQVSSLKNETAVITVIAYKDTLTDLKNRYLMYKDMNEYIKNKQQFLLIFIDLNNLKKINDDFDHSTGDAYLKQFARALKKIVHDKGEVYRFAGDEFICLITDLETHFDVDQFKQSIANEMVMEVPYYGMSLGCAHYPNDGIHSDDLVRSADHAMYLEKKGKSKSSLS